MLRYLPFVLSLLILLIAGPALADAGRHDHSMDMGGHGGMPMPQAPQRATLSLSLTPQAPLVAGKTVSVVARLATLKGGKPVSFDDLREAHTKKLHLLIIDPMLSDYHHIHPAPGGKPGEYVFAFTPGKDGGYRIWADVVPRATGKQEYVQADLGEPEQKPVVVDRSVRMSAAVDGYQFTLTLDRPPSAGQAVMGSVTVSKDGQPFTGLEPVMGAFAHIVAFPEDLQSVLHVHPMGMEPTSVAQRGGPTLDFHLEPAKPGFVKLFAQVRSDGKDVFAPFGVVVK